MTRFNLIERMNAENRIVKIYGNPTSFMSAAR